jgi:hypothetical protein
MITRNFLTQSSHKIYFEQINSLLNSISIDYRETNHFVNELMIQKGEPEQIFVCYKTRFDELRELIRTYRSRQIQILKTMRKVQLAQREKTKDQPEDLNWIN